MRNLPTQGTSNDDEISLTGQLGESEPELQNIPVPMHMSEDAVLDQHWKTVDFSEVELRTLAGSAEFEAATPKKVLFPYRYGPASLIAAYSVEASSEDRIHKLLLELGYTYNANTGEYLL